jgi:DNA repair protein SbcD/Mre11
VSDLHLGRGLGELSREAEQRLLVRELGDAAKGLDVAMTVIAGDVFDAFTPPAWAEDLWFELLDLLADGGRRAVAVIAGNHDSAVRVAASDPITRRLGIILAGDIADVIEGCDAGKDRVRVVALAPQVARVEVPRSNAAAVIALLPFLSEARVARDPEADEKLGAHVDVDAARYAARLAAEARSRAEVRQEGLPHVLAMHQYVTGGLPSDSERRLRVGALSDLDASSIPGGLDYVALGHLHRPQEVVGAASPSFYAGSPIAYSFSEAGQDKRAILVELGAKKPAKVRDVRLTSGRPLEIWPVRSLEEARARADETRSPAPIVDVRADFGRRLGGAEAEALFSLSNVSVASVRDLFVPLDAPREIAADDGADAPVEELFRELYKRRIGKDPDDADVAELVSAVLEVGRGERGPAGARG